MQKLKVILILLLTIFLESCQSINIKLPIIENHERCSSFIVEVEDNLYSGKCRCHEYQVSEDYIGRIGESYDKPLDYCSKQVQFSARTWSEEYLYFFDEIFFMKKYKKQNARDNKYNRVIEDFFPELE